MPRTADMSSTRAVAPTMPALLTSTSIALKRDSAVSTILAAVAGWRADCPVLILSDYAKGVLTDAVVRSKSTAPALDGKRTAQTPKIAASAAHIERKSSVRSPRASPGSWS